MSHVSLGNTGSFHRLNVFQLVLAKVVSHRFHVSVSHICSMTRHVAQACYMCYVVHWFVMLGGGGICAYVIEFARQCFARLNGDGIHAMFCNVAFARAHAHRMFQHVVILWQITLYDHMHRVALAFRH